MALAPLPILLPTPPNFCHCSAEYGTGLTLVDCLRAGNQFPSGTSPVPYIVHGTQFPYVIPFPALSGRCMITLEQAGPTTAPGPILLTPDDIRGMIGNVVQGCVERGGGVGGFQLGYFEHIVDYLADPEATTDTYPSSSSFFTVSVSTLLGSQEPGDEDKTIPLTIGGLLTGRAENFLLYSRGRRLVLRRAQRFYAKAMSMAAGSTEGPWWQASVSLDDMDYECDVGLGAPGEADCTQLQYSQLGGTTDNIMVGPGTSRVLSSSKIQQATLNCTAFNDGTPVLISAPETCNVAVTASHPIAITWEQVQAATDTIISLCVSNPLRTSIGGKAFYGQPASLPSISSRGANSKRGIKINGVSRVNWLCYGGVSFLPT